MTARSVWAGLFHLLAGETYGLIRAQYLAGNIIEVHRILDHIDAGAQALEENDE